MGFQDNTLNQLRMANLRWKIALLSVLCLSLIMGVELIVTDYTFPPVIFNTIHMNIEIFCVFVAFLTFTVTWYSYLNNCSYYSYFIGLGLLAVGFIDLFHLYNSNGIPTFFSVPCPNRAALFHIAARLIMSLTFISSVFLYKKEFCLFGPVRLFFFICTLTLIGAIILTVSFTPEIFPVLYNDGFTQANQYGEFLVIFFLTLAFFGYSYLYRKYSNTYLELIVLTLVLCIFSEICFTINDLYGPSNVLGHIFRFSSYVLIYLAVFLNNVKHPYLELYRAREELANANTLLEEKVRKRTMNLEEANKQLARAAKYDYLTNAANRMEFSRIFNELLEKTKEPTVHTILAIDFDSFKKINDTYGHAKGDECLKTFVQAAKEVLRPTDTVSRFGGDEFVLLLPETTKEGAIIAAEKIRKRLSQIADPPFTISIGTAEWSKDGRKEKDILTNADLALYIAKEKGKNRVE